MIVLFAAACSDDAEPAKTAPLFPLADYAASYQVVRDCRTSIDHDLSHVRVLASPEAVGAYTLRNEQFPVGAILVKEQYADDGCTELEGFSVMKREPNGYAPGAGDWHWQRVSKGGSVELDGKLPTCTGCHKGCGVPPDGHDWTCAVP